MGVLVWRRLAAACAEAGPQQPGLPLPVRQRLPQEMAKNALSHTGRFFFLSHSANLLPSCQVFTRVIQA